MNKIKKKLLNTRKKGKFYKVIPLISSKMKRFLTVPTALTTLVLSLSIGSAVRCEEPILDRCTSQVFAEKTSKKNDSLIKGIEAIAYDSYEQKTQSKKTSYNQISSSILNVCAENNLKAKNINELNKLLEDKGLYLGVNKFQDENGTYTSVELLKLISRERRDIKINGTKINYELILVKDSLVKSFREWKGLSRVYGLTYEDKYVCNISIGTIRGKEAWNLLSGKRKPHNKIHEQYFSLAKVLFSADYSELKNKADGEKEFVKRFTQDLVEGVAAHEAYHIHNKNGGKDVHEEAEAELIAYSYSGKIALLNSLKNLLCSENSKAYKGSEKALIYINKELGNDQFNLHKLLGYLTTTDEKNFKALSTRAFKRAKK